MKKKSKKLTSRECEIMECVIQGFDKKQIKEKLAISSDTVKNHFNSIYIKLECHNQIQAIMKYLQIRQFYNT